MDIYFRKIIASYLEREHMDVSGAASVLFVDDNEMMAKTLKDISNLNGFNAQAAYSIDDAIALHKKSSFDCIFSDVRLVEGTGLSLFQRLQQKKAPAYFILMSAYIEAEFAKKSLAAGVLAVVSKPIPIPTLLGFLEAVKPHYCFQVEAKTAVVQKNTEKWLTQHNFPLYTNKLNTNAINIVTLTENTPSLTEQQSFTMQILYHKNGEKSSRKDQQSTIITKPLLQQPFHTNIQDLHRKHLKQILSTY